MTRDFVAGERKRTVANLVMECLEKECVRHVISWRRDRGSFYSRWPIPRFLLCLAVTSKEQHLIADFWWPADRHRQVISTRSLAGQRGRKIVLALRCLRQLIKEGLAF